MTQASEREGEGGESRSTDTSVRWQRLVAALSLLVALALLAMFGYKIAASSGWVGSASGGGLQGAPGVFTSGRAVQPPFRQAPDFTLELYSGETLKLSDLRGKPVMVNFWASWCPPCREEAPLLEETWREYREKGVVFIGVNIWDTDKDARRFLSEYGITYPNGASPAGQTPVAVNYGLTGIPETYFIDRNGEVTRKWIGPFNGEELRTFLDEILASGK